MAWGEVDISLFLQVQCYRHALTVKTLFTRLNNDVERMVKNQGVLLEDLITGSIVSAANPN